MKFAILKNAHLGLNGLIGHHALRPVVEDQEQRFGNVYFQNLDLLNHCVWEKRKRPKNAAWTLVLIGQTGRNGHLAQRLVVGGTRNARENASHREMGTTDVRGRERKLQLATKKFALPFPPGVNGHHAPSLVVEE